MTIHGYQWYSFRAFHRSIVQSPQTTLHPNEVRGKVEVWLAWWLFEGDQPDPAWLFVVFDQPSSPYLSGFCNIRVFRYSIVVFFFDMFFKNLLQLSFGTWKRVIHNPLAELESLNLEDCPNRSQPHCQFRTRKWRIEIRAFSRSRPTIFVVTNDIPNVVSCAASNKLKGLVFWIKMRIPSVDKMRWFRYITRWPPRSSLSPHAEGYAASACVHPMSMRKISLC